MDGNEPDWSMLLDSLLLKTFMNLDYSDIPTIAVVCKSWRRVSCDEFLWRHFFYKDFQVDSSVPIMPGRSSWRGEYRRLVEGTPVVETEELTKHDHQVLHVSFSHQGDMFATSSKDGHIIVWTSTHPVQVKYAKDMKIHSWKYTQFSQFNSTDTLLLVSGVHFGNYNSTSGEIAVFNLEKDFQLQCRVLNKPYDIFGTWYNDQYLLSGDLHWLAHLVSRSVIWLNKASQETSSEHDAILVCLYKFYNRNASSVRTILVSNCLTPDTSATATSASACTSGQESSRKGKERDEQDKEVVRGNPPSLRDLGVHKAAAASQMQDESPEPFAPQSSSLHTSPSSSSCSSLHTNPITYTRGYRDAETTTTTPTPTAGATTATGAGAGATEGGEEAEVIGAKEEVVALDSDSMEVDSEDDEKEKERERERERRGKEGWRKGRRDSQNATTTTTTKTTTTTTTNNSSDSSNTSSSGGSCSGGGSGGCGSGGSGSKEGAEEGEEGGLDWEGDQVPSPPLSLAEDCDKFLIFTTGSKTYSPHQIGFKRIKRFTIPTVLEAGPCLRERIQQRDYQRELRDLGLFQDPNWLDFDSVADRFDAIDHLIDLNGHIIGMGLSPDHRYLYVNSRPWQKNSVLDNPLYPPCIAEGIDLHVIDLTNLTEVGTMLRSHKAYTPNDECFFIFLDVSHQYVASGAEDKHGYIWERHYGVCLSRLPHQDVVNAVAFNPRDPEMLVTVSDDHTIKVWRSRRRARALGIDPDQSERMAKELRIRHPRPPPSPSSQTSELM